MARWAASAKWAEGPALDGQRAMPLTLRLSEGLGVARGLQLNIIVFFIGFDGTAIVVFLIFMLKDLVEVGKF